MNKKISIIIPTLNEEIHIAKCLEPLQDEYIRKHCELILVDGLSKDKTIIKSKKLVDKYIYCQPDRSHQQNIGASHARGDILIFLHADTIIDRSHIHSILENESDLSWGFFRVKFDNNKIRFKVLSFFINMRSTLLNFGTGDQCLVVDSEIFERVSGFPDIRLMEDIQLCFNLKKSYEPIKFKDFVTTSSRRWEQNGYFKTIFMMNILKILYLIGIETKFLKKLYR